MSAVDKNQAVIDYLLTCTAIAGSTLYFNFINAKDASTQFITLSNDKAVQQAYIDGSILKKYSMTVTSFLAISDIPIPKVTPKKSHKNVTRMEEVQSLMRWINAQDDLHNYPNFGTDCVVEEIKTTTDNPMLDQIDTNTNPPLAKYSFTIEIAYIDYSHTTWNQTPCPSI